ncbi:MAG TPA: hypothetical protein VMV90_15470 [Rectinemataceae bacterium]|nr:hypothetical protein [Rectinemataceae bacterium]
MVKRSAVFFDAGFFLQLCLGVFFLTLGIMGLGSYSSRLSEFARFFGRDDTLRIVMSVVELVMGAILLIGLFFPVSSDLAKIFSIILFVLWGIYLVIHFILGGHFLKPNTVVWLYDISWNAAILVSLWIVGTRNL